MKIYYVGFYDFQDSSISRGYYVSAVNKMTYITRVLQQICPTEIVSLSLPKENKFFYRSANIVRDGINVHFLPFCGLFSHKKLNDRWRTFFFFLYGLFHFTSSDVIISYHSPSFSSKALAWLRKIKKFKVVLEVEEIYADLLGKFAPVLLKREMYTFQNCDAYIFSTEFLADKVNKNGLPYVTIYGTYQKDSQPNLSDNDSIHVIYAGTFDPRKGGAAAAAAAAYLPKNYIMHVCGFGSEEETKLIRSIIDKLKAEGHNIHYEGLLKGQNYLDMLHKCQIGLSPQDPDAKFNSTSFPSKILSYMSAGLAVVSINIPAIRGSYVSKGISFYDSQTPQEIANAIVACDISQGERNRNMIASLDVDFREQMKGLIEQVIWLN